MRVKRLYSVGLFLFIVIAAFGCKPEIDSFSPETNPVSMRVGSGPKVFNIETTMTNIKYKWVLDNVQQSSTTKSFIYTPTLADIGSHTLKVTASNSNGSVSHVWLIGVELFSPIWDHFPRCDQ